MQCTVSRHCFQWVFNEFIIQEGTLRYKSMKPSKDKKKSQLCKERDSNSY